MQLIRLEHGHWSFFCPVTGEPVYTEAGEIGASSFRGGWHHEVLEDPLRLAPELQNACDAYLAPGGS